MTVEYLIYDTGYLIDDTDVEYLTDDTGVLDI